VRIPASIPNRALHALGLPTASPDGGIQEVGKVMLEKKIGGPPVIEGGKLVGLITETDILRHCMEFT